MKAEDRKPDHGVPQGSGRIGLHSSRGGVQGGKRFGHTCGEGVWSGYFVPLLQAGEAWTPQYFRLHGTLLSEPTVEVIMPDMPTVIYGNVNEEIGRKIVRKHILKKQMINEHLYTKPAEDIL